MKPSKTSPDYALFRLRAKTSGSTFEVMDQDCVKTYGTYASWAKVLESLLKDHPIDTLITFQWQDSDCISFVPMSLRDWFTSTAASRGVLKGKEDADMVRLEGLSASYHSGWAA